ncbi:MAG TPA: amidohydrolase family protein, partial [Acidimicrobiia bacterium]|nr:amidohydrolase family protein [Acidimicrobiia bacterium]
EAHDRHRMIVDTHVHVVARDEARFPLRPSGIGSQWFREHPVAAEEYLATAAAAGVDRAVLVQAHGAYGTDNAYVLDAVQIAPERWVGVVIVDPADADAAARLRGLAAVPGCEGVRLFGIGAEPPAWFDGDAGAALWDTAVDLDLRIVATLLMPDLPRLDTMLTRHPGVPVVLDHCGFPPLDGGPSFPGLEPLLALARHPGLHLKVTSHVLEGAGAAAGAFVDRLVATFGAARLVWGSDYPQTHDRTYAELVALGRDACAGLTAADQAGVLGENALRLWPSIAP